MGLEQLHDGAHPRRERANAGAPPDRPTDPHASPLALLLTGTSLSRVVVAALLLTVVAAPFLKGILAGFALAGAAAAVRDVLGA